MKEIRVAAAIITENGKIFATQRGYGPYKDWWEFPGGKLESGESAQEALVREIREELAADIAIDSHYMTVEYDYPEFHLTMACFLCHLKGEKPTLLEHEDARWLKPEELLQVNWLPADAELIRRLSTDDKELIRQR